MASAALAHEPLLPRDDSRLGLGAALALLAHAGLIGALALGLNWRLPTPTAVMSAELWSAVPQVAAPAAAPTPPPAPAPKPAPAPAPALSPAQPPQPTAAEKAVARDAEIALEKAAQRKKEQQAKEAAERDQARLRKEEEDAQRLKQKLEAKRLAEEQAAQRKKELQAKEDKAREEKRLKDLAEQREKQEQAARDKAQEAQIAKQREENLKRMLGQAGAAGTGAATATGSAARDAGPSVGYTGRIIAAVKPNIVLPAEVAGNPITEVEVRCAPDGSITGRRIVKSSGNPVWDETVLRAIDRTAVLPRDVDGRIPSTMTLKLSRRE